MKVRKYLFFLFIAVFTSIGNSFAQEQVSLPAFTKDDSVLIFSPHPGDETINTAGVIQRALKAGAKVRVVCFANGDSDERAEYLSSTEMAVLNARSEHLAVRRRGETMRAMDFLKVNDVQFMCYPDFFTMEILLKYWGNTLPCKSSVTEHSSVPYEGAVSYKAPYVGESILKDMEAEILSSSPTKIFVSHAADLTGDHRALYLFLHIALWDLEDKDKIVVPQVYPYIFHVSDWPVPLGDYPALALKPPAQLKAVQWIDFPLTLEEITQKHKAISFYTSQLEYNGPYLLSFVRLNELFGDYPVIKLKKGAVEEDPWHYLAAQAEANENSNKRQGRLSNLAYAIKGEDFLIKFNARKMETKDIRMTAFLLGYNRAKDFAQMPKIEIDLHKSRVLIRDKGELLSVKDASFKRDGKAAIIKIPLSVLGDPDRILCCVTARAKDFSEDEASWRVLEIE